MDKEENNKEHERRTRSEENKNENEHITGIPCDVLKDDPGPSRVDDLPGAIPYSTKNTIKAGISKSEHCIRQIITSKDVAKALQLTSCSFGTGKPNKSFEETELKIPVINSVYNTKDDDATTLVELKKFMASCFKTDKHECNTMNEVANNQLQQAVTKITNDLIQSIPNTCNFANKGYVNKVVVTNSVKLDNVQTKILASNKIKTPSNISEKSDFGLAPRDSLSSIGSNVCRICMTKGRERLISPCNCKGSLANVHLTCLERWLNQVGRNHCELCGFSYPAIRTPRYTVVQALRLWFGNPRNRSHLQSDCLIFWLLSTVTAGLLAVCIVGTQYFVIEGNNFGKLDVGRKNEGISHRITETAMNFFMVIVLCGYSVTVYLLWKDHFVMWNRWRRANVNVRLLLSPDSNPVPFVPRARYNIV